MTAVISLRDVVEALDLQSDELSSYLDPNSGEIITFNEEQAGIAERGDWGNAPDWMRELLPKIKRALEDGRMLPLPDRAHIDEWRMMQDFADRTRRLPLQGRAVRRGSRQRRISPFPTRHRSSSGLNNSGTVTVTRRTNALPAIGLKKTSSNTADFR